MKAWLEEWAEDLMGKYSILHSMPLHCICMALIYHTYIHIYLYLMCLYVQNCHYIIYAVLICIYVISIRLYVYMEYISLYTLNCIL